MTATNSVRISRLEKIAVSAIIILFLAIGIREITNGVSYSQDWAIHSSFTERAADDPTEIWSFDSTNPPGFYAIGAVARWVAADRYRELYSGVGLVLAAGALLVFHRLLIRMVDSGWIRIAAITLFAFLPVTLIHSVAFAADSLTTLPFLALCLLWAAFPERARIGKGWMVVAAITALLLIGNLFKYTFIVQVAVGCFLPLVFWRGGTISLVRAGIVSTIVLVISGGFALYLRIENVRANVSILQSAPQYNMSWRSLLLPRVGDHRIFNAIHYFDPVMVDGRQAKTEFNEPAYTLLETNSFSYIALTHLAVFTDVLDLAKDGMRDGGGQRDPADQSKMEVAVKTGVIFTLFTFGAVVIAAVGVAYRFIRGTELATPSDITLAAVVVSSVASFLIIAMALPFVNGTYYWGYWLPRLILPAIAGFVLISAYWADRIFAGRFKWSGPVVFSVVVLQSMFHVSFLWQ